MTRWWPGFWIALAVVSGLAAAVLMGSEVRPLPGTFDQVSYDALAQRVASGAGFSFAEPHWPATAAGEPTAHWSFLYTGWLAAIYFAVGHEPLLTRLLQALLVGVAVPLGIYRLTDCVYGARAARAAVAISAVYAYFTYYSAVLMTEMFTIGALVWFLYVAYLILDRPTHFRWLVLGLLLGMIALLRQVAVLPAAGVMLWVAAARPRRAGMLGALLALAVAAALVSPVAVRNYRVFGRLVPVNTNAGYAFFWANHPIHGVNFQGILSDDGPSYAELIPEDLRGLDEASLGVALMWRGFGFVVAEPGRYLLLSVSRVEDYFRFWPSSGSPVASNATRVASFGLLLPFMVHGLLLSRAWLRRSAPLYVFVASYTAVHLLSWALVRYRLPVDAVLLVFAGLSLSRVAAVGVEQRLGPCSE